MCFSLLAQGRFHMFSAFLHLVCSCVLPIADPWQDKDKAKTAAAGADDSHVVEEEPDDDEDVIKAFSVVQWSSRIVQLETAAARGEWSEADIVLTKAEIAKLSAVLEAKFFDPMCGVQGQGEGLEFLEVHGKDRLGSSAKLIQAAPGDAFQS